MSTGSTATESGGEQHSAAAATPGRGLIPRLGSALALAPLGVWVVFHLWDNLYAFNGEQAWKSHVTVDRNPVFEILTSTAILLPLILHMIWGIRRMRIMRVNVGSYTTFDNIKFILQRLSAIGLILFLGAHIWKARLEPQIESGSHESFKHISCFMRNHPPTLIVYILGVLGTAYHLANGVSIAGMTWGYAATPAARKKLQTFALIFMVVLMLMGFGAIYTLYDTGAKFTCHID